MKQNHSFVADITYKREQNHEVPLKSGKIDRERSMDQVDGLGPAPNLAAFV